MSLFRSQKNSKGSLQLKLKGASAWPFNARNKVPTGWICDTWSLYRDTAVPAEGNGDLQTLICVFVARPRQCLTLSNPVPWQNWMVAYLGYTLLMRTLFRGWPIMVNDTHTRRRYTKSDDVMISCVISSKSLEFFACISFEVEFALWKCQFYCDLI